MIHSVKNKGQKKSITRLSCAIGLALCVAVTGCTESKQFRLNPTKQDYGVGKDGPQYQNDAFPAATQEKAADPQSFDAASQAKPADSETITVGGDEHPVSIDILWVIDNSVSMDPSQEKLRKALGKFADKYMRPDWDIRLAAITTDTYLAHPAFANYLNTPVKGSKLTPKDLVPAYANGYSKLLPGIHDGPIAANCVKDNWQFFLRAPKCQIRDSGTSERGPESCLHPKQGQSSVSQCVNTLSNDSVRTGKPILSTKGANVDQLRDDFIINTSTSTTGSPSERGMGSVLQLISDNEVEKTAFFRKGSFRVIVFLSDEDDQTMRIPETLPADFGPWSFYKDDSSCDRRLQSGYHYHLDRCPDQQMLVPVATIKSQLNSFFEKLDGIPGQGEKSFTVAAIVVANESSVPALHKASGDSPKRASQDMGRRYLELAKMAAASSGYNPMTMDIAGSDYSPVLNEIGKTVALRKADYPLNHQPKSKSELIVELVGENGKRSVVPQDKYSIVGSGLRFDVNYLLSLKLGETIQVRFVTPVVAKDTLVLNHAPTQNEQVVVTLIRANGSQNQVKAGQYSVQGNQLKITDQSLVSALKPGDKFDVKYVTPVLTNGTLALNHAPTSKDEVVLTLVRADGSQSVVNANQYAIEGTQLKITDAALMASLKPGDRFQINYIQHKERTGTYTLQRVPTSKNDMTVRIVHADGTATTLNPSQYALDGKTLTITDSGVIAAMKANDRLEVNYQPGTVF